MLSRSFLDFVHPDDVDATISVINEKLKKGQEVVNFINRYSCKDGTYKWLEWVSYPKPETGNIYSIAHDITDRKKMEDELIQRETIIRSVMDNLPIGIAVNAMQPPVSFEYINKNFVKFYRTTIEAVSDTDTFWEAVYEDPEFRRNVIVL